MGIGDWRQPFVYPAVMQIFIHDFPLLKTYNICITVSLRQIFKKYFYDSM